MLHFLDLEPDQATQYINAESLFKAHQRTVLEAKEVRGSMYWRSQSGAEYLIRESPSGSQKSLGPRSETTNQIYSNFKSRKENVTARLKKLQDTLVDQQRLNKALRVGRVPNLVVKTLNAIADAGMAEHFTTIGTYALYAYESAAGVRVYPNMLATIDIDLLFDSRKRLSFFTQLQKKNKKDGIKSLIEVLKIADPSFKVRSDQKETAVNDKGFEVDIVRRIARDGDPHPLRMSDDEEDLWAVQVAGADTILGAPRFSQMVVAETGHMAMMTTMSPKVFVTIKKMIAASPNRDPRKRNKDALQATVVAELIHQRLPQFK
ncbi:MAG: hypothetical protein RJB10_488 [Pseudomonadota bacterium]|jgi:hypothetical protein